MQQAGQTVLQEQQMLLMMKQAGQNSLPNPVSMPVVPGGAVRRNATAGPDLLKAAAAAAGAAAAMKPPQAQEIFEDDDDDEAVSMNKCAKLLKQCNVANIKIWSKMFLDGASLRPGLSGICFTQIMILVALALTGMYPDMDALVAISKPEDMRSLVNFGTADYASIKAGEIYRMVACLFVHGGVLHLIGCLGLQIWFGEHLEFNMGAKHFIMLFTPTGVAGTLMGVRGVQGDRGARPS